MNNYQLYTDGSHMPLYNMASIGGYILSPQGQLIEEFSQLLQENETFAHHEVMAVEKGLKIAISHGIKKIDCYSDSSSISNMMSMENKNTYIENTPYFKNIVEIAKNFEEINFHYLPRKENKKADKLSRQPLLEITNKKTYQVEKRVVLEHFYSTEQFLKNEKDQFKKLKKTVSSYLVFDFIEKTHELNFYAFFKEKEIRPVNHKIFLLNDNWTAHFIKIMTQEMTQWIENNQPKQIGLVIRPEMNAVDKMLRGVFPLSKKTQTDFLELNKVCQRFEKIVLNTDNEIMIFLDKLKCELLHEKQQLLENIQNIRQNNEQSKSTIGVAFKT